MFLTAIVLALVCGAYAEDSRTVTPFGRIVNGEVISIEETPWQVSIQVTNGQHFCGGSLIGPYTVITAAHCMGKYAANRLQVRAGSSQSARGGKLVGVRAFYKHPKYDSETQVYDVAIVHLSSPIYESATTRYVTMTDKEPAQGSTGVVSGWGVECYFWCTKSSSELQKVEVRTLNRSDCRYNYSYEPSKIRETMLCAYEPKKDSCQGDSGGPLVAGGKLIGVVSWGKGCGKVGYPGVYANVAELRPWIDQTINRL